MKALITALSIVTLCGCGSQQPEATQNVNHGDSVLMHSLVGNPDYLMYAPPADCNSATLKGGWDGERWLFAFGCEFTNIDCFEIGTYKQTSADEVEITVNEVGRNVSPHNCLGGTGKYQCSFKIDNYTTAADGTHNGTLVTDCHRATE